MIRRSVDNVQWLTQNHTDFEQAWYYTRHILDDFVLIADDYYPSWGTPGQDQARRRSWPDDR